jgi:HK97 family phage portal protein
MAILKKLLNNLGVFIDKRTSEPVGNQEVGLSGLAYTNQQLPSDREAIYPAWFFSSRLGQPRQVDTRLMRELAQSSWVQMVLNTFKKQIYTTDWDVTNLDESDETDRKTDIQKVKDFLMDINENDQTIDDVNSELVTDIGEIDAGVMNLVYSNDSYLVGEVPVYDAWGNQTDTEIGLVLKPLGRRELVQVKSVDGSSMLKQVDIHKNLLNYWQYSFKHPRQNPTRFEKEEIVYIMMNGKSYSVYGFSPVQAIQQILELLIQGTRYNKDLYTNNAIPDLMVSLPKLSIDQLRKLKRSWENQYKGKPHQLGFVNWAIDQVHRLAESNRDLEWLDGQKWYFKIAFGVFGVSPTEAGFFENSNRSNDEGQERVTVRNAVKPYFKKLEQAINKRIITEILQKEDHGLKFEYKPKDHTLEKIEFEQDMQELDHGALTINEYRKKKGREVVDWGDDPLRRPFDPTSATAFSNFAGDGNPKPVPPNLDDLDENEKKKFLDKIQGELFKKEFEGYMNGKQRAHS